MKVFSDLAKILFLMACLGILQFFVKYWIDTQDYTLYSTVTGIIFFITVAYVLLKEVKI